MLRLTRTAIGLLTAQYRSVLRKCWAINVGVFSLMGKAAAGVAGGVKDIYGTLSAFGVNVMDSILLNLQNKKFVTLKALPAAVVAATVMATTILPSDAYAGNTGGAGNTASYDSSSAFGYINYAGGSGSSAVGYNNTASGLVSSVFGHKNTASGEASSAFGYLNTAYGKGSIAIGNSSVAGQSTDAATYERYATAVGVSNKAEGMQSSTFGWSNTASGHSSSAFGAGNTASGQYSSAFGAGNTASGLDSTVVGAYSNAAKDYTTAIGYQAVANVAGTTTQGIISVGHKNGDPKGAAAGGGNYTSDYFSKIINVAAGSDAHDAVIVEQLGFTIGSTGVYTGNNKVYTSVADYVSNNYYRNEDFGGGQVIDFTSNLKTENFAQNERFLGVANDNFAIVTTSKVA